MDVTVILQFQSSAVLKQPEKIPTRQTTQKVEKPVPVLKRVLSLKPFKIQEKTNISSSEKCFYSCNTMWCVFGPVLLHPLAFVNYQTSPTPSTKVRVVEVSPFFPTDNLIGWDPSLFKDKLLFRYCGSFTAVKDLVKIEEYTEKC